MDETSQLCCSCHDRLRQFGWTVLCGDRKRHVARRSRPLPGAQECEALTQAFSPVRQPWRLRLFATEDRVGGPRCRTTELGGRDRHHPALELRLLEDRLRELGPRALAVCRNVPNPVG